MTLTLLLDLDDTLLNTNLEAFVPAYFQALAKELSPHIAPQRMLHALMAGTNLMNESQDFSRTLEEVFTEGFYPQIDVPKGEMDSAIENFYDNVFPALSGLTSQKKDAKPFVDWAFSKGWRIAIATDPLLPRKATYHRLRWAGFQPEQFELISTYDHFHFSKTHPAYYAEVLGRLGWPEGPVLMVGNDMERDILPAQRLGLTAYHIDDGSAQRSGHEAGLHGDLTDLRAWLESIDLSSLIPSFKSRDSVMGILYSSPAVLCGLIHGLEPSGWKRESVPMEWTCTELVCHLRDMEREVHLPQMRLFEDPNEPFIRRPDTSVWVNQRDYRNEDGRSALNEYMAARRESMETLGGIQPQEWSRSARHAIFGPTNFLEVIGFMADHDRMHIQQVWNILKAL